MGLFAANGLILRISSEAVTPVEKINALPKVQRHPVIYVIYAIGFPRSVMFVGYISGIPSKNMIKKLVRL